MKKSPKLDHVVNQMIWEYPTLYRVGGDPKFSRMLCLEHIFLCYGTAMEWAPEGYMYYDGRAGKQNIHGTEFLPEGYFDKELFAVEVESPAHKKLLTKFIARLRKDDIFHYCRPASRMDHSIEVVFEWDRETVRQDISKFFKVKEDYRIPEWKSVSLYIDQKTKFRLQCADTRREAHREGGFESRIISLYPTSEFSPIREIMKGKTNSLHVENFDLKPLPDWLSGAIEVAEYAVAYYGDDKAVEQHFYHPKQSVNREEWDLKDAAKRDELEKYRKEHGYKEDETPYQRLERSFVQFRAGELKFFKAFLSKFGNSTPRPE
jgi:hypothetical protein